MSEGRKHAAAQHDRLFAVPPQPSEKEFQATVLQVCRIYGWTVAHFRPALTKHGWRTPVAADGAGFPDLLIAGHGRVMVRELKSTTGRLSADQVAWLDLFTSCGISAGVWRPGDWELIVSELGGKVAQR